MNDMKQEDLPHAKSKETQATPSLSTGPHRFRMEAWISCAPFELLRERAES